MSSDKEVMCTTCRSMSKSELIDIIVKPADKYYYTEFSGKHFGVCNHHSKRYSRDKMLFTEISKAEYLRREKLQAFT